MKLSYKVFYMFYMMLTIYILVALLKIMPLYHYYHRHACFFLYFFLQENSLQAGTALELDIFGKFMKIFAQMSVYTGKPCEIIFKDISINQLYDG